MEKVLPQEELMLSKWRSYFTSSISFQKREKGLSHQIKMSDIAGPEGLKSELEIRTK